MQQTIDDMQNYRDSLFNYTKQNDPKRLTAKTVNNNQTMMMTSNLTHYDKKKYSKPVQYPQQQTIAKMTQMHS